MIIKAGNTINTVIKAGNTINTVRLPVYGTWCVVLLLSLIVRRYLTDIL